VSPSLKPAQAADVAADAQARRAEHLVGVCWRRVPRTLWSPHEVFVALRAADEDDETARQEPILAVVLLAGMSAVLLMGGTLVDDRTVDGLVAAAVTFFAGGLYGAAGYFVLGVGVWLGVRGAGAEAPFRRARHVVAFSAVPIAVSFFLVAPAVIIGYGLDFFRGTAPSSSTWVVLGIGAPFLVWAGALLVTALRVTYRLAWLGVATALAFAAVLVAAFVALPSLI
jgi:hypothetical protein